MTPVSTVTGWTSPWEEAPSERRALPRHRCKWCVAIEERPWCTRVQTRSANPRPTRRMQHDRFAREIVAISAPSGAARLRRLMRNPLDGGHHTLLHADTSRIHPELSTSLDCPKRPPGSPQGLVEPKQINMDNVALKHLENM